MTDTVIDATPESVRARIRREAPGNLACLKATSVEQLTDLKLREHLDQPIVIAASDLAAFRSDLATDAGAGPLTADRKTAHASLSPCASG
jgi:hypothetical protein